MQKNILEKLQNKMPERLKPFINRETVSYLIFGVLTTLLDLIVFELSYHLLPISHPDTLTLVSNTVAWVAAVLFAFVTNKLYVFRSKSFAWRLFLWEFLTFVAARVITWGISSIGMILLVDRWYVNELLSKILVNVIVIILNYVFSKLFVFRRKGKGKEAEEENEGKKSE